MNGLIGQIIKDLTQFIVISLMFEIDLSTEEERDLSRFIINLSAILSAYIEQPIFDLLCMVHDCSITIFVSILAMVVLCQLSVSIACSFIEAIIEYTRIYM